MSCINCNNTSMMNPLVRTMSIKKNLCENCYNIDIPDNHKICFYTLNMSIEDYNNLITNFNINNST